MSLPSSIASAILDTVLDRVALLLLSGAAGDLTAARHAAAQMLAAHDAQTEEEVRLAGEIISFGLHALQALGQAADPGLSLNHILRFRSSAVSLSRESHKFQRQLDRLQRARQASAQTRPGAAQPETAMTQPETVITQPETSVPQPETIIAQPELAVSQPPTAIPQPEPGIPQGEAAAALPHAATATGPIERTPGIAAGKSAGLTWTQSYHQRLTAKRRAAKVLKQQAKQAARAAASNPASGTAARPHANVAPAPIAPAAAQLPPST